MESRIPLAYLAPVSPDLWDGSAYVRHQAVALTTLHSAGEGSGAAALWVASGAFTLLPAPSRTLMSPSSSPMTSSASVVSACVAMDSHTSAGTHEDSEGI